MDGAALRQYTNALSSSRVTPAHFTLVSGKLVLQTERKLNLKGFCRETKGQLCPSYLDASL